jgi:hypothetical protein
VPGEVDVGAAEAEGTEARRALVEVEIVVRWQRTDDAEELGFCQGVGKPSDDNLAKKGSR